jgi:hypothetical protein
MSDDESMSENESMTTSFSLADFYRQAKVLHKEDQAAFVKFVLSGFDGDERFYVDALRHSWRVLCQVDT